MHITARFALDGVPATGLSPTVTVYKVSDHSVVVNAQTMTEIGGGWYEYSFVGYDSAEDYVFGCDGGSTLEGSERYPGGATNAEGDISDISVNLLRALGLLNENSYLDQMVYSGTHLTSGRLRTYSNPASVGTSSDVLATYTITATWEDDLLKTYEVVKQ